MKKTVRARFPKVRQLATGELANWLQDSQRVPPLLLDVRKPEEFAVSHLSRAIQVDPEATAPDLLRLAATNQPIVVYCSVGYRSSALAARLMAAGFTNVYNLEGSIFAWANEQRPLERDGKLVKEVHPYNAAASRMLQVDYRAKVPAVK
ncbi:MAG: rhodanese-like domain-containing protein [Verrucomicrobia bacterium]|nr:rhodanese-like domain-containing protein [Verrucomicrobiota bacterium]